MSIDYLAKRFYVISHTGEVGPVGIEELGTLLESNRIHLGDTVRSAFGKSLGTVADVIQGKAISSGSLPGVVDGPVKDRRRRASSDRVRTAQNRIDTSSSFIWALGVVVILVVILGLIRLIGGGTEAAPVVVPTVTESQVPEVILAWGRQDPGRYELLVRTIAPVERDVVVRVQGDSPATGVSFDPPGGTVIISARTTTASLMLKVADGARDQQIHLRLVPSDNHRSGSPEQLDVTVKPRPKPTVEAQTNLLTKPLIRPLVVWDPPTIAWEPFSWTAAGKDPYGLGWSDSWYGNLLTGSVDSFPVLSAYPGLGSTVGYGVIMGNSTGENIPTGRGMLQKCTSGTFWLSVRAQPIAAPDGTFQRVFLCLAEGGTWRYTIVCEQKGKDSSWWSGPTANGKTTEQNAESRPFGEPVLVVLRLQLDADGASTCTWIDPPAGQEPTVNPARCISGIPPFIFDAVKVKAQDTGGMRVADLRIGRTWQEVVPPLPGPLAQMTAQPSVASPLTSLGTWAPPSIAWDPFTWTEAGKPWVAGIGWKIDWYGDQNSGETTPFPALSAYPRLPPTMGCAIVNPKSRSEMVSARRIMAETCKLGTFWLSFRAQPILAPDGTFLMANIALTNPDAWVYFIRCRMRTTTEMSWISGEMTTFAQSGRLITLSRPLQQPVLMVLRLTLEATRASSATWLDPPAGHEPVADATNSLTGLAPFEFNGVKIQTRGGCSLRIADLRIGRTWQEVVPPLRAAPAAGVSVMTPAATPVTPPAAAPIRPLPAPTAASSVVGIPPSIAWEPFSWTASGKSPAGSGWFDGWDGNCLSGEVAPFPVLSAYPRLSPAAGCGILKTLSDVKSTRRIMAEKCALGTYWWSVRIQPMLVAESAFSGATLVLADPDQWRYAISCIRKNPTETAWCSAEITPKGPGRQVMMNRPLHQPVLMVVRLQLEATRASTATWIDPPAGREPVADAANSITGLPPFSFSAVRIQTMGDGGIRIADMRIGRTWQEVVPPLSASAAGDQPKP